MLAAGVHPAKLDHTITFHTAEVFRRKVEKAGLRFVGTTGKADFDYRDLQQILKESPVGLVQLSGGNAPAYRRRAYPCEPACSREKSTYAKNCHKNLP
jgi:hypothetical protein